MSFAIATYGGSVYGMEVLLEALVGDDGEDEEGEDDVGEEGMEKEEKRTMKTTFVAEPHINTVKAVAHSKVGNWMVSGGADETIRIYNTESLREYGSLTKHQGSITCLEFHQDTHLFSGSEDGTVCVWTTKNWECSGVLKGHEGAVLDLSIHPSGRVALTVGKDKTLRMWDLTTGRLALTQTVGEGVALVCWSPDASHYIVVTWFGVDRSTIDVFSADGTRKRRVDAATRVLCACFVTETLLATGGEDKFVTVYDVSNGDVQHCLKGHDARVRGVDVYQLAGGEDEEEEEDAEMPLLGSASTDGTIKVWDLSEPGKPIATATNERLRLTCMCSLRPLNSAGPALEQESQKQQQQKEENQQKQQQKKEKPKKHQQKGKSNKPQHQQNGKQQQGEQRNQPQKGSNKGSRLQQKQAPSKPQQKQGSDKQGKRKQGSGGGGQQKKPKGARGD